MVNFLPVGYFTFVGESKKFQNHCKDFNLLKVMYLKCQFHYAPKKMQSFVSARTRMSLLFSNCCAVITTYGFDTVCV